MFSNLILLSLLFSLGHLVVNLEQNFLSSAYNLFTLNSEYTSRDQEHIYLDLRTFFFENRRIFFIIQSQIYWNIFFHELEQFSFGVAIFFSLHSIMFPLLLFHPFKFNSLFNYFLSVSFLNLKHFSIEVGINFWIRCTFSFWPRTFFLLTWDFSTLEQEQFSP